MKLAAFFLFALLITVNAYAVDPTSITFTITSSAVSSTANLRIATMPKKLANWSGRDVQSFALEAPITNYFITKSVTYAIPSGTGAIMVQADQDTKMYLNTDYTNFIKIYADTNNVS